MNLYEYFLHPLSPTVERQLYIDQSNLSHLITNVWWEGNLLKGRVETCLTERGRDMQGLIRQGMQVAFSMRGFGPVSEKKGDIIYIRDPLHILTYDWVLHPSHRPAYMQKVLAESTNLIPLSESYFIPLTEESITNYLNCESKNIKSLKDQLNFQEAKTLGKKGNLIYFQEGNNILAAYLEDYINIELDRYLANL